RIKLWSGCNMVQLRPYQEYEISRLRNLQRAPLIAPKGSGKTRMCLEAMDWALPVVVVCPPKAVPTWRYQAQQWIGIDPDDIQVIYGNPHARRQQWQEYTTRR